MATRYWRTPIEPLARTAAHGIVHVVDDRCKGCGWCIEFCPRSVLYESEAYNRRGYHPPKVGKEDDCLECRLCEFICPEFAIYVTAGSDEEADHA